MAQPYLGRLRRNAAGTPLFGRAKRYNTGRELRQLPTAIIDFVDTGLSVDFENIGVDAGDARGNTAYLWDFGDTNTSTDVAPTHVYGSGDTYTVTLTVTDDLGFSAVATEEVTVAS